MKHRHRVTLIPGDGIGPEVSEAATKVIDASGVDIDWEVAEAGAAFIDKYGTPIPEKVIDSIRRNKVALKGPVTTPVGKGFKSVNVTLRKSLNLYANIRPIKTYKGVESRYDDVDLVIFRENTEDLYAGIEFMVNDEIAQSVKIISRNASRKIVKAAFEYAVNNGRKKVTAVHKANIMKLSDGLFLRTAQEVASEYSGIEFDNVIVDAMSMKLVLNPEKYDVLVMPNLYGDILSDLASGLVGGLGLVPGANIGEEQAIFEPAHGSAPDIAGQNKANPTAIILSSVMMLKYLHEGEAADRIEKAVETVLRDKKYLTPDLGGSSTTYEFANAVISKL
ncbi:isocitrate/isopropylmalate dehydrogenase family protein [Clostridium luticellarii]|jgi:isocitrate dehydrogenase (NAD+)|uniref:Isocitrate dehydrogenase n=1 Tax=Clostridium luticellarii TaxID=1691940 RepID=A0A2T0BKL4_9CLOT|nr:isocitrate/isopropylmalate dehydrogenase family protein [Clostridium luticellarii]MCI1946076.1 isocitrate/isopropylmalate dehydrogenase family protein [Clostridium luticellarii]MCI1967518.1 isocitrate/isopropylmalate dehydrogenase family protein [Clostridium luticellarii]MCI1996439.1 isocitrate/isopropylmalate dehydrogenase family protein [Clostridium luticellarii]MCI2040792.1 isocitrate/isopropylmalate dehydrogenase family protein [Clostridium luticellarii]PRR84438.1 Isocitrate dehydrogena